ncbi:MAG: glycosyltransferase family 87 protein [Vicinamibacterales bacterium]
MISDAQLRHVLRSDALVALMGDLIRALAAASVAIVLWVFYVYYASLVQQMFADLQMNDFGRFYYSARAFLEGRDMYGPTLATAFRTEVGTTHLWNMNPPHFHILVLPFALLAPLPALIAWAVANVLALVLSLRLIATEFAAQWTWQRVAWTAIGVIVCSATGIIIVTGQWPFLLMLPVTVAWIDARNGRWRNAALWLGVVAGLKPFLAVFGVFFVVTRRWSATAWMTVAASAGVVVGIAVFGWHAYMSWMVVLGRVDWAWAPMNASIEGLITRSLADDPLFVPLLNVPAMVQPLTLVLSGVVAIVTLAVASRGNSPRAIDRAFAGLLLAALLISPLGWVYYLWLAAGPLVALWTTLDLSSIRARGVAVVVAVPGLLLPIYMTILWRTSRWGGVTIGSTYTWTLLALWTAVMLAPRAKNRRMSNREVLDDKAPLD